ncbi:LysR family transcriptional regulator [Undibacterium parvum]|uniref:LysR family transcriptional regulator n=2 Tax=Undibacterium parvum TaxID=401471 RepID=A0A3Q9BPG3_9BURK|nr:LysR family transcriptional regulator [Undibacterium parvum]
MYLLCVYRIIGSSCPRLVYAMHSSTLPSLSALQSFEAAARLGSFSKAALERNLTHSAVSRHIQAVEYWCGEILFQRNGPKVDLLPAGQILSQRLGTSLQALRLALNLDALSGAQQPLKVYMLSSLAHNWFIGQLHAFSTACPQISLSLETGYEMVSLPPQSPAVAIRYGHFGRTGLRCHRLWFDHMVVVAAPAWLEQYGEQSEQWPAHQFLRHTHEPWPIRLPKSGLAKASKLPEASGHEFNDALLLVEAASQGCGIAWVRASLVQRFVKAGHLRVLVQAEQMSEKSVWLVCREDMADLPQVRDFCLWAVMAAKKFCVSADLAKDEH